MDRCPSISLYRYRESKSCPARRTCRSRHNPKFRISKGTISSLRNGTKPSFYAYIAQSHRTFSSPNARKSLATGSTAEHRRSRDNGRRNLCRGRKIAGRVFPAAVGPRRPIFQRASYGMVDSAERTVRTPWNLDCFKPRLRLTNGYVIGFRRDNSKAILEVASGVLSKGLGRKSTRIAAGGVQSRGHWGGRCQWDCLQTAKQGLDWR